MAQFNITPTAQLVTTGLKQVVITSPKGFKYGFGNTEPTTWHSYFDIYRAFEVGTMYGKMWIKSDESFSISVTEEV